MTGARARAGGQAANIALRLAKYFCTTLALLNLQSDYELRKAQREIGAEIEIRVHLCQGSGGQVR